MQPSDFIHPEDAAALRQMESLPGFTVLIKKILSVGLENLQYGVNMASGIRLSDKQLPELYQHLPPICERFGIQIPEFYLQMDPNPNAWTFGDTRIYVTVTSGLVDMMTERELDAILAHECGHILCRHVLYHTIARWLRSGITSMVGLDILTTTLQYAILYWSRKSELSADRAASIYTSPETVASTMARLSGGPRSITSKIDLKEWARQADEYDNIQNENIWNKTLQLAVIAGLDHPFCAVRVREILRWGESHQYDIIKNGGSVCPGCGRQIKSEWKFCRYCGYHL